jgi:hypothetical protein
VLENQRQAVRARRDSLNERASALAAETNRLKEKLAERTVSLDQYRLEEALRRSQALADSLDAAGTSLAGLDRRLADLRRTAGEAYSAALDSLSQALETAGNQGERRVLLKSIEKLRQARASLSQTAEPGASRRPGEPALGLEQLREVALITPQDSQEEIREKADFLSDVAGRWSRALEQIRKGIGRLSDEKEIRQRLGEFAQEISLFDGTAVSSRTATRSAPEALSDKAPAPGTERAVSDFAPVFSETGTAASTQSLDLELYDPEADLRLLQNLEHFSRDDLESAISRLAARSDSLQAELGLLRALELDLRKKAGEIGNVKEGGPPK